MVCPFGSSAPSGDPPADLERRQQTFLIGELRIRVVAALDVRASVAGERDRGAAGRELRVLTARRRRADPHRDSATGRRRPSGRDRPHPDHLVEAQVGAGQLTGELGRSSEGLPGGPDRLVRLLRVLDLPRVAPRPVGEVLLPEQLGDLRPRRADGNLRQQRRVGAHVGDVAPLVQTLRDAHDLGCAHTELAAAFLLQR